jgi:hypothetical protein
VRSAEREAVERHLFAAKRSLVLLRRLLLSDDPRAEDVRILASAATLVAEVNAAVADVLAGSCAEHGRRP